MAPIGGLRPAGSHHNPQRCADLRREIHCVLDVSNRLLADLLVRMRQVARIQLRNRPAQDRENAQTMLRAEIPNFGYVVMSGLENQFHAVEPEPFQALEGHGKRFRS
jgi:hypothetical protein